MKTILLKFRINPNKVQRLIKAGCPVGLRTAEREKQLIQQRSIEATHTYNRVDAAGHKQVDTGEQILLGENGQVFKNVCVGLLWNDIPQNFRKHLTSVHILQKEGDHMAFLCVTFGDGERMNLPRALKQTIKPITQSAYEHVQLYINPNGVVTVNCAHVKEKSLHRMRIKDKSIVSEPVK